MTALISAAAQAVHVTVNSPDHPWRLDFRAGAAILTALATGALAVLAVCQIRAGRQQAADARKQADAAISASKDQVEDAHRQAAQAMAITRAQADAAIKIATETREAAHRQWQPRVFARKWGPPEHGNGSNAAPDEMAIPCYLVNEGTGPAFNVEFGIEVAGEFHAFRGGQWWAMQAQEFFPPLDADAKQPVPLRPIYVGVKIDAWNANDYVYIARFENLLAERFEVRSYPDTTRPSEFRQL